MRVDTTVVETNIHYPTDSGLLSDGARVLTRTMKKIAGKTGGLKRKVRDRTRSVRKRVMAIAQAVRHKGMEGERKRRREYRQLLRPGRFSTIPAGCCWKSRRCRPAGDEAYWG